jgi:hypothetical protein
MKHREPEHYYPVSVFVLTGVDFAPTIERKLEVEEDTSDKRRPPMILFLSAGVVVFHLVNGVKLVLPTRQIAEIQISTPEAL